MTTTATPAHPRPTTHALFPAAWSPTAWWLLGGSVALLVLHLWLGLRMRGPLVFPDEAGLLGHPGWFLGDDPLLQMGATSYYSFGYSLFLVPAFAVLSDPDHLYTAAMVVNALLLTAVFPMLYLILRRILGVAPYPALLGAAAGAVYPAVTFAGNHAWTEPAAIPVFCALVLTAWLMLTADARWQRMLFGPCAALAYAIHPRFTGVVAVVLVLVGVAWWSGRIRRHTAVTNTALLVAGFMAVRLVNSALFDARWAGGNDVIENSPEQLARTLGDPGEWRELAAMAVGQGWYLVVATLGLFVLGVVVLARRTRPLIARTKAEWRQAPSSSLVAGFVLVAALAMFVASIVFMTVNRHRVDHLVYGRYNEAFLPVFLACGTAVLATRRRPRRLLVSVGSTIVTIAVLALALRLLRDPALFDGTANWPTITGIFWQVTEWPFDSFGYFVPHATVVALVGVGALGLVAWKLPRVAAGAAVIIFLLGGVYAYREMLPAEADIWYEGWSFPDQVENLDVDAVAFDASTGCAFCFWRDQWFLPDVDFETFDSDIGEAPSEDLVIAPLDWTRAEALDARLVIPDGRNAQGLWVLPGSTADELEDQGRLLPAGFPAALPPTAMRSEIDASPETLELEPGGSAEVDVEVTHAGDGGPWVDFDSYGLPGLVRLHTRVLDDTGTEISDTPAEIPELTLPGDRFDLMIPVSAVDAAGQPLPPGEYTIEISLSQEGFARFADAGDDGLTVPLRVT
ncbi:MAG: hypothetical protein M5U31_01815 [Acidimicrobiia bacterium]|nr:hypothetical protein [Acidimicrobiia bacterium]